MNELPLQKLTVADFRRINGRRDIPLDAPIVLIHGPNGTGKTSLLSALELALTGEIRSMERQSDSYWTHLPNFGAPFASVQAVVNDILRTTAQSEPVIVSDGRLQGIPAFGLSEAKFYAERCYLDQSSLGRLLDLYQARLNNEQSALERFVNELLGLETLDALREGLSDANDLRVLKKLAIGADEADRKSRMAVADLESHTVKLTGLNAEITSETEALRSAVEAVYPERSKDFDDEGLLGFVASSFGNSAAADAFRAGQQVHRELIMLGGRISSLASRPRSRQSQETRIALEAARQSYADWEATVGKRIADWEARARVLGVDLFGDPFAAIDQAARVTHDMQLADARVRERAALVAAQAEAEREQLNALSARVARAHEHSSSLLEGLVTLRPAIDHSNICPVCDRDYAEVSRAGLLDHVDAKLAELSEHSKQIIELQRSRDDLHARLASLDVEHSNLESMILTREQRDATEVRRDGLDMLLAEVAELQVARANGAELDRRARDLQDSLDELEAQASEERHVVQELTKYAEILQADILLDPSTLPTSYASLLAVADAGMERLDTDALHLQAARDAAERLTGARERHSAAIRELASIVERKGLWEGRFAEAKRRQGVARELHNAATQARTTIVNRVFTESLNDVWKTVFTTLAPGEEFIPSFGIPEATKKTFDIRLETTRRGGEAGGPPQMMLSAGNLNTAALSLFVALHLAVEPVVPCLVFDDPVQAMDEVHIAQFAGLIRLLAKQHGRQVVIAVHERELFDYLSLELSPAFEGDELITIELGDQAEGDGVTRYKWVPDHAIAV